MTKCNGFLTGCQCPGINVLCACAHRVPRILIRSNLTGLRPPCFHVQALFKRRRADLLLNSTAGATKVYKVRWWMGHYGHVSPKRHKAFTNNKWAAKFNLGKMKLKRFRASQDPQDKPTVRYVDKRGRSRFHGNASLKLSQWPGVIGREPKSEPHSSDPFSIDPKHGLAHECAASFLPRVYPVRFGWKTVELMPKLKSRGQGRPVLPETLPSGPEIFNAMSWHTEKDWSDARLKPVLVYLKGNRSLNLPDSWKAVFPRHV